MDALPICDNNTGRQAKQTIQRSIIKLFHFQMKQTVFVSDENVVRSYEKSESFVPSKKKL